MADERFLVKLRFAPAGRNLLEELPTLQRGIGMDLVFAHVEVAGVLAQRKRHWLT
jgi:hypothetical protein